MRTLAAEYVSILANKKLAQLFKFLRICSDPWSLEDGISRKALTPQRERSKIIAPSSLVATILLSISSYDDTTYGKNIPQGLWTALHRSGLDDIVRLGCLAFICPKYTDSRV